MESHFIVTSQLGQMRVVEFSPPFVSAQTTNLRLGF